MNRQGPDFGSQYRSVIFYHDEDQHAQAKASLSEQQKKTHNSIVTQIVPALVFHPAEEYHQQYIRKTGRSACHV
jgi:peptide-methionine (S)-S-oxide reductase